jgi:hypothetical protein
MTRHSNEPRIRGLVDTWARAARAKNLDDVLATYDALDRAGQGPRR